MKFSSLSILYEDEELILLDKPPRLLTLPDRFKPEKPNLYHLLLQRFGKIYPVHRLDKNTSGIICFTKTQNSHHQLNLQFEKRSVKKQYLALVEGTPSPQKAMIKVNIARGARNKMVVHKKGKPSSTEYRTIENLGQASILELILHTGRTHQIRLSLQSIGHPLLVDPLYGTRAKLYFSEIKKRGYRGFREEEKPLLSRTPLHSSLLDFVHPGTGENIRIESKFPKDVELVIKQLRKWSKF